jgi:hypothetical protein
VTREARLDLARRQRLGMVEAVWGEHKSAPQIAAILRELAAAGELALVTRVGRSKARAVVRLLEQDPSAAVPSLRYVSEARALVAPEPPATEERFGRVAVLSGGSSDRGVAEEARLALACHGVASDLILDVGVAGLHRLLDQLEALRRVDVVIACAGMEGALPTVVAGLVPQPVIGVPVAVGYGVSAGGTAALHGMLSSCAPGLTVVNIGNGYGAAMAALRILRGGIPPATGLTDAGAEGRR